MGRFERLELGAGRAAQAAQPQPPPSYDEGYYLAEGDKCFYLGDYEAALLNYSRALRFKANCEEAWVGQVKALIELNELEEALIWVDKGLQKFKDSPPLLASKGRILARLGDSDKGIAYVDAALQQGTPTPYVWLCRADVLLAERAKTAKFCFEKALEGNAQSWQLLLEAALICLRYQETAMAQRFIQKALQINADHPFLWCVAGDVNAAEGQRETAKQCYRRALAIEPHFKPAQQRLEERERSSFWGSIKSWFQRGG